MPISFKARLQRGLRARACLVELFSPLATEILAQAGFQSILIDLEHGPGSLVDALAQAHAVGAHDCAPIVRVAESDPIAIQRVLDLDFAGVMVPKINSRSEAEAAVRACRFAPRGCRGFAANVRAAGHSARWKELATRDDVFLICEIETPSAVASAAEIAAVEGVDMVFIGQYDLSVCLGHGGEPEHPEVQSACARIEAATKAAGKLLGTVVAGRKKASDYFAAGYDWVVTASDNVLLLKAARVAAEDPAARS